MCLLILNAIFCLVNCKWRCYCRISNEHLACLVEEAVDGVMDTCHLLRVLTRYDDWSQVQRGGEG